MVGRFFFEGYIIGRDGVGNGIGRSILSFAAGWNEDEIFYREPNVDSR
jgi:hypothetical protein